MPFNACLIIYEFAGQKARGKGKENIQPAQLAAEADFDHVRKALPTTEGEAREESDSPSSIIITLDI